MSTASSVTDYGARFWVAFAASFLVFGLAFPAAVAFVTLAYAFSFAHGVSPVWLLLADALVVGFLFLVRQTDPRPVPRGIFLGCLVGSLLFVVFIFLINIGVVHPSSSATGSPVLSMAAWPNPQLQPTRSAALRSPLSLGRYR
jgi:hypothetical protein